MRICLIGDLKFVNELDYMRNELEKSKHIISIPILQYKVENNNLDNNFYDYLKNEIIKSDYIILIVDEKNESFIFNYGIVYGSNKKFKIISKSSIDFLMQNCSEKKRKKEKGAKNASTVQ